MPIYSLEDKIPKLSPSAWVAPGAVVIGVVTLEATTSVWFGAVIRAENDSVVIGEGSNVQDGCVLHVDPGYPLDVHKNVTIGHKVMLHGCTIGEGSLIGIGSIVLNGAVIGKNTLVGANTLISEGKTFPDGVMILGSPGKVLRELTEEEQAGLQRAADNYQRNSRRFHEHLRVIRES